MHPLLRRLRRCHRRTLPSRDDVVDEAVESRDENDEGCAGDESVDVDRVEGGVEIAL